MRLFLAMGLTLIVCLGAAFRPSDNLPGREAGAAESCRVIGGYSSTCTIVSCGVGNGCDVGLCYYSGSGTTCTANCSVAANCSES
jgi:hypothetical protein